MIVSIRTARIQSGKIVEATAFAKEACTCAKDITRLDVRAFTQVGGRIGMVCWIVETNSLAHYEEAMAKLFADAGWQKLAQKAPALFADGETADQLWRSL